ncbi:hypothetical protein SLE2022_295600 [Rubroshorea leprosula]
MWILGQIQLFGLLAIGSRLRLDVTVKLRVGSTTKTNQTRSPSRTVTNFNKREKGPKNTCWMGRMALFGSPPPRSTECAKEQSNSTTTNGPISMGFRLP